MTSSPVRLPDPSAQSPLPPEALRLRRVHRAASDLRRGLPVLIDGPTPLVLIAAETAGDDGIGELAALTDGPPLLLLAPVRAAAVLHRPVEQGVAAVAAHMPADLLSPEPLRSLADPTAPPLKGRPTLEPASTPALAPAAIALLKIGRLLPTAVAAPARADIGSRLADRALVAVAAEDVLAYPAAEALVLRRIAAADVPLADAPESRIVAFRAEGSGVEHLAIVIGKPGTAAAPLVRLHSECFTGDLLGSMRCDCGEQLRGALRRMAEEGAGVLLYLAQEGRGIGLVNKLRAYALQDRGLDTLDANRVLGWGADERNFMIAATMLQQLGLTEVRLLTNNPDKLAALQACGIAVVGREAHAFAPNGVNDEYLATKAARFGHLLD
ncbi:MAG: GTP cyclohydrolase II [Rhodospirillales bacterium 69-11]|nr:GTP cyclohydrolase II [Rhodospirillales bacterium]OJW29619.1 MAG: GTP cyclohydrolase II [Rhodospirillales bacterium 69-11]